MNCETSATGRKERDDSPIRAARSGLSPRRTRNGRTTGASARNPPALAAAPSRRRCPQSDGPAVLRHSSHRTKTAIARTPKKSVSGCPPAVARAARSAAAAMRPGEGSRTRRRSAVASHGRTAETAVTGCRAHTMLRPEPAYTRPDRRAAPPEAPSCRASARAPSPATRIFRRTDSAQPASGSAIGSHAKGEKSPVCGSAAKGAPSPWCGFPGDLAV